MIERPPPEPASEPWLERYQRLVCTIVAAFLGLVFLAVDRDLIGWMLTAPHLAIGAYYVTWVVLDFVIAAILTRRLRRLEAARHPPPRPAEPSLPRPDRLPLPRAVARMQR